MNSAIVPLLLAGAAAGALAAGPASGPAAAPAPLRADHPLLGAWRFTADDGCVETWRLDPGGHALVTSASEVAEIRFALGDRPSPRGFFKWVGTLYRDNGKKDCAGQVTQAPRTTTRYVLLNGAEDQFIFCVAESTRACFGPFVKVEDGEI